MRTCNGRPPTLAGGRWYADEVHAGPAQTHGRVLVVEDEEAIRETLADALRDEGYEVECARDGLAALAVLEARLPRCPDVILLDLMMPRMNGWAFVRAVRELPDLRTLARVPVVLLSAARDLEQEARQLGVDGHIAKPFDLGVVLDTVGRLASRTPR